MEIQLKHILILALTVWLFLISLDMFSSLDMSKLQEFYNKTLGMPNVTHTLDYVVVNYKYAASSLFASMFAALVYYLPTFLSEPRLMTTTAFLAATLTAAKYYLGFEGIGFGRIENIRVPQLS